MNKDEKLLVVLIEILLDQTAREDERDDAAMDLADFNDSRAINALAKVATDSSENYTVRSSAGNSLGCIWCDSNKFDIVLFEKLSPIARLEAFNIIKGSKPEWIELYKLTSEEGGKKEKFF